MKYIKYIFELVIEFVLIIVHFPMYLLNELFPLKSENKNFTQKYPIILVERWFRHNVFHIFPKIYLEKKGFKVYTINYTLAKGSFNDAAKSLEEFINKKRLSNVVLIGISAGALTCMHYLQKRNGWEKTKLFISIGGPLKGSPLSRFIPLNSSFRDMNPSSNYFKDLYKNGVLNKDNIYSIYATSDNLVGVNNSILEGTHKVHIDVVGHNLLHTFWIPTYEKVVSIIENL